MTRRSKFNHWQGVDGYHVLADVISREEHSITYVEFQEGMENLKLITRNLRPTQIVEHSI